jgi:preprotein translocase subunit SecE
MEAKVSKQANLLSDSSSKASTKSFVTELKEELKKVSWTTKAELIFCTKLVIGATFFLGLGIYLVDLAIKGGLDSIGMIVRFIFGG